VVDADLPLISPHLTRDQVLKTAKAEFSGDPAFIGIVAEGLRETVGATVGPDCTGPARPTDPRRQSRQSSSVAVTRRSTRRSGTSHIKATPTYTTTPSHGRTRDSTIARQYR
jgi:hypothetical protein